MRNLAKKMEQWMITNFLSHENLISIVGQMGSPGMVPHCRAAGDFSDHPDF